MILDHILSSLVPTCFSNPWILAGPRDFCCRQLLLQKVSQMKLLQTLHTQYGTFCYFIIPKPHHTAKHAKCPSFISGQLAQNLAILSIFCIAQYHLLHCYLLHTTLLQRSTFYLNCLCVPKTETTYVKVYSITFIRTCLFNIFAIYLVHRVALSLSWSKPRAVHFPSFPYREGTCVPGSLLLRIQ